MRKSYKLGILQAFFLTLYCSLVGLVMWKGNVIFGKMNSFIGPVAFLVMFTLSAMICGLLVFYKPFKLFIENKKTEAVEVVIATAVSLFVILLILFGVLFLIR